MRYNPLGKTGIHVSALSFGGGPISRLMIGDDVDRQHAVIRHAIHAGINWFDTAATYGDGRSERNLGRVLEELRASRDGPPEQHPVHVATKVRLLPEELGDIRGAVRRSFEGSLERLRMPRVTLLQLHNSITGRRGEEPTSVTLEDVLAPGGIADAFEQLREEGLVSHLGLTGIGQPAAMREVVRSGRFATMQVPYHLVNPSAGREMSNGFVESNYGNIIAECARMDMGVLAIRVLAGGALVGNPPSPHTVKTPYFPLALYERDRRRAARMRASLGPGRKLQHEAIRFALAHPHVSSALIGFAETRHIDEGLSALEPAEAPLDLEEILLAEPLDPSLR